LKLGEKIQNELVYHVLGQDVVASVGTLSSTSLGSWCNRRLFHRFVWWFFRMESCTKGTYYTPWTNPGYNYSKKHAHRVVFRLPWLAHQLH